MIKVVDSSSSACKKRLSKFLPACTGLYSIYISACIKSTIEHMVDFTGSAHVTPFLRLYATFEENIVLLPNESQVKCVLWGVPVFQRVVPGGSRFPSINGRSD